MAEIPSSIAAMSFETALAELEGIVRDLENGKTSLEQSISAYERGVALKMHCEAKLRDAQSKIEKIMVMGDGTLKTAPLDPE